VVLEASARAPTEIALYVVREVLLGPPVVIAAGKQAHRADP
jgi:hypothetical protein